MDLEKDLDRALNRSASIDDANRGPGTQTRENVRDRDDYFFVTAKTGAIKQSSSIELEKTARETNINPGQDEAEGSRSGEAVDSHANSSRLYDWGQSIIDDGRFQCLAYRSLPKDSPRPRHDSIRTSQRDYDSPLKEAVESSTSVVYSDTAFHICVTKKKEDGGSNSSSRAVSLSYDPFSLVVRAMVIRSDSHSHLVRSKEKMGRQEKARVERHGPSDLR
ncbi:hypothetical protein GcM1_236073 [Golovinomyces cichoracearum]|uniref:Uncharacterized protein n=1 Tax=Golovinomyces cichoracearum TaxID=62708 RepID=A0A420IKM9_9PEZI|nr:hypothetical protein GcM1_236073 [Golovinomyces cichoracearum]